MMNVKKFNMMRIIWHLHQLLYKFSNLLKRLWNIKRELIMMNRLHLFIEKFGMI
jgi:hypothetical protein